MKKGKCGLCNNEGVLLVSHMIPNFISKWLKNSSGTGFFRNMMGKRKQDLIKMHFLCKTCEDLFSKFEYYFANNFFYPLMNDEKKLNEIEFNEYLIKFIISLSWRILHQEIEYFKTVEMSKNLEEILEKWRNFLLNKDPINNINSNYLLFWFDNRLLNLTLQKKTDWYIYRGTDATYASNPEKSIEFVFVHIPGFSIISSITPKYLTGFKEISINKKGIYNIPFKIMLDHGFTDFLNSRILAAQNIKISENEKDKIKRKIEGNKERWESSRSKDIMDRTGF